MTAADRFDEAIEAHHAALIAFMQGNPEPFKAIYSHADDVTLANPFGPPARGWSQVAATLERAAAHYQGGEPREFTSVAKGMTADLAYTLELERFIATLVGLDGPKPITLRVTTVFRPEGDAWKVVHRHADPISAVRSPDSVVER